MSLFSDTPGQPELMNVSRLAGGTVYGVVLNDEHSLEALDSELTQAPYQRPPRAPILYIKPRNTVVASGTSVELPTGEPSVEVGATLGLVVGRTIISGDSEEVLASVAGLVVVADLSIPHASYYRPAVREKCFDGACPISDRITPLAHAAPIEQLAIVTSINGKIAAERRFDGLVRTPRELLADVTEFMTLRRGDTLLLGVPYQAPQARAGDTVTVSVSGVGDVTFTPNGSEITQ